MNVKVQEMRANRAKMINDAKAIANAAVNAGRAMTDEEDKQIATLRESAAGLMRTIDAAEKMESESAGLEIRPSRPVVNTGVDLDSMPKRGATTKFCRDEATAYKFGQFAAGLAIAAGVGRFNANFQQKNRDFLGGINALQFEGSDIPGGNLVAPEFSREIIDLRETFGTFRRNVRVVTMGSDTLSVPRRTSGLTMYAVGEGSAITASSKTWDLVKLVAKKAGVISVVTNELNDDAMVSIGDDLIGEIAYSFALGEDNCGWNGTGTVNQTINYMGIQGVTYRLKNISGTIALIGGLTVASGTGYATNWDSIVLSDINKVIGNLPAYADTPSAKFYCHRTFYYSVLQKLAAAAGGTTFNEVIDGVRRPMFLGYPVEFVQVMPRTSAVSQVCLLFGDLSKSAMMGNRKDISIEMSRDASVTDNGSTIQLFQSDCMAIRGIERFDINVHDVGTTTTASTVSASQPAAGPIVGLITAAS